MSEETKVTQTNKKFTLRDLTWVLIGVIAGILIGWAVFTTTLTSTVDSVNKESSNSITTEADASVE